jgi:NitT/TauT family transport system ATP-binding protein
MTAAPDTLTLNSVSRTFPGNVRAVDNITLSISGGEFVAILGPSGCGKSTLLRMIAGLDKPTVGAIGGTDRSKVAYVFQDAHLLPWRCVARNVALPLELCGVGKRERLDVARNAIEMVGLTDFAARFPAELSGGMRMRVSLARALVTRPQLLLLDEPFAALDEITRTQLDEQLRSLWRSTRMTVIFVTHSITEAAYLADRAVVLSRRPARIIIDQPIELPSERPQTIRGEARFAAQTRVLLDALQRGGQR